MSTKPTVVHLRIVLFRTAIGGVVRQVAPMSDLQQRTDVAGYVAIYFQMRCFLS
ncbi:hypothetical protein [Bradyrhizobium cenepequi]